MYRLRSAALVAAGGLVLGSWGANVLVAGYDTAAAATIGTAVTPQEVMANNVADHDDPSDRQWKVADEAMVRLNGSGATSDSADVAINAGTVTVQGAGTYRFTGTLTNGAIVVNTTQTGTVRLVFDGVTVANSAGAPVQILDADKVVLVLADGTTNRVSDAAQYPTTEVADAALFSRSDLTITGAGALTVTGKASDGIGVKDGLVMDAASLTVQAADDGIRAKDYLVVQGGSTTIQATGDGLKATEDTDAAKGYLSMTSGDLTVTSGTDALSAGSEVVLSGGTVNARAGQGSTKSPGETSIKGLKGGTGVIIGGTVQVKADCSDDAINSAVVSITGGNLSLATNDDAIHADSTLDVAGGTVKVTSSFEALEALKITIAGGTVDVVSRDDAVNAVEEGLNEFAVAPNAFITISGGTVTVNSTIDGLDSNGRVTISGGTVVVNGPALNSPGEGALDANGTLAFTGGTLSAMGSYASTSAPASTGGQGWVSASLNSALAVGTVVHLANASGTRIASWRTTKSIKAIIYSSPQITQGSSYSVRTGGSVSGTNIGGLYTSGDLTGSTSVKTVTAGQHSGGGWPGFPGFPGGPGGTQPTGLPPTATPTAVPTATPTATAPQDRTCTAVHSVLNEWSSGFQGQVTVKAGNAPIDAWTVTWQYSDGRTITQFWNASITTSGSEIKAQNVSHNGSLSAGSSVVFGFTGTAGSTSTEPSLTCQAS